MASPLKTYGDKEKEFEQAETNAKSAYEKAVGMKYRWAEGDAGHLLGEIYLGRGDKRQAGEQLKKAAGCRKKIKDPKVKESETVLEGLRATPPGGPLPKACRGRRG